MCLWLQTDQTQLLFHFPLDQPCSQGSLSCFEKDQTLVMWKWITQQGQVPHYILLTGLWNTVWGREKILSSKQCLSFWVGFKVCCFRLVSIALFWRKIGYLFREFVLEKRFACCSANRIWKILRNSHVQNPLFVNLHTLHMQFMTRKW